ncbi:MAG: DNA-binding protein [Planctomycetes bacterium]|nr:DNA-binding protein [Planctomycetota bacterium]
MRKFSILFALNVTVLTIVSIHGTYAGKPAKAPQADVYMKPSQDASPQETSSLSGKIVETMNSGGYTYLCIEKDGKKTWVAIPETKMSVGENISLPPGYEMVNFTSKTLNRTFEKIVFTTGPTSAHGASDKMSAHGGSMGSKSADTSTTENIKVEKASGSNAYTVAEIFGKKSELDKKSVVVSGKVVKVSAGIMGKNWLHLQDGSGDAKDGNNDLVVTTQDIPKVGDIVTATGTLYKDKDFGSGYKYDVIIEEATIKK